MLYFAYGSNMDWRQMRDRCPSARFVGIATLRDHRLAFTRHSDTRGCGVADVVPATKSVVWGVVYEIDDRDIGPLDRAEGYRPGRRENPYRREERHVLTDDDEEKPLVVAVYFATAQPNPPLPDAAYKKLIRDGAEHWHLPEHYVKQLEGIEVKED